MGLVLGIDPGSAHVGIVGAFDCVPVVAATIDVDPSNIAPAWAEIRRAIVASAAAGTLEKVVVEWGLGYMPKETTPQAAASILRAREVMTRIVTRIEVLCEECRATADALPVVVPFATIAPGSWRHRIGMVRPPKEEQGPGWQDRAVVAALRERLGSACERLRTNHERDAFGAIWGEAHPPAPPPPKISREPREPRECKAPTARVEKASRGDPAGERVIAVMREHGRPIRLDVLAALLGVKLGSVAVAVLPRLQRRGAVVKVSRGIYALAE